MTRITCVATFWTSEGGKAFPSLLATSKHQSVLVVARFHAVQRLREGRFCGQRLTFFFKVSMRFAELRERLARLSLRLVGANLRKDEFISCFQCSIKGRRSSVENLNHVKAGAVGGSPSDADANQVALVFDDFDGARVALKRWPLTSDLTLTLYFAFITSSPNLQLGCLMLTPPHLKQKLSSTFPLLISH
ncbi:hypothetical protein TYRP_009561 [Tyrophagus putrescentiae]|nr:hypothetical protein TYRP_009561 [Tyrophagus putrescentiae]